MTPLPPTANPDGSIIYRSGLNPKIQRNFEVFTPCDFIGLYCRHEAVLSTA